MSRVRAFCVWAFCALQMGCALKDKEHTEMFAVSEDFLAHVQSFEQDAQIQGIQLRIDDLIVQFGPTSSLSETGVCEITEGETPKVTINRAIWEGLTDDDREEVIYHELGHCVFRRGHQNGEVMGYNGTFRIPASIMYPYRIPGIIYRANQDHYHNELFDRSKFNQF